MRHITVSVEGTGSFEVSLRLKTGKGNQRSTDFSFVAQQTPWKLEDAQVVTVAWIHEPFQSVRSKPFEEGNLGGFPLKCCHRITQR